MLEDQTNEETVQGTGEGAAPSAAETAPVTKTTRRRRSTKAATPPALPDAAVDEPEAEAVGSPADSSVPAAADEVDSPEDSAPAEPRITVSRRMAPRRAARTAAGAAPAPELTTESATAAAAGDAPVTTAAGGSSGSATTTTTTTRRTRGAGGRTRTPSTSTSASAVTPAAATAETAEATERVEEAPVEASVEQPAQPDGDVAAAVEQASDQAAGTRTRTTTRSRSRSRGGASSAAAGVVFQAPDASQARTAAEAGVGEADEADEADENETVADAASTTDATETAAAAPAAAESTDESAGDETAAGEASEDSDEDKPARRRRRRGGRRRRRGRGGGGQDTDGDDADESEASEGAEGSQDEGKTSDGSGKNAKGDARSDAESDAKSDRTSDKKSDSEDTEEDSKDSQDDSKSDDGDEGGSSRSSGSRRRRRRRRSGDSSSDNGGSDDPENTVTKVRKGRSPEDEITSLAGSTRLEAKKQRRREGREAGRRKAPIVSEAEFLARRESVDRTMVVRQGDDLTQIAVLEDKVLVEHYVARKSQTSMIGNVYLGKVQNVLPSMEAAFIDIGKGRNAVLYAGEVNWRAVGAKEGQPRKIEQVLKSGQSVLVQVSKDPIGQKGARLTGQISLPGRFLVYVPDGTTSGISRKLPDTERSRLKSLLKQIVPSSAGVIVRTAAEGASEDELTRDVERLKTQWESIEKKVAKGNAPQLLHGEPDLTLKVVRDVFTEDFAKLVVSGDEAWSQVHDYVTTMAPDLAERLEHHEDAETDVFAAHRVDEQLAKALDHKVWLPSGGSLIIDRTEAMTVVDVNTGKFTGSGGNLEETVTKNNLEAAEEIVRQLRLRDIGGIIVVDFIDMVLENNRDLVLRRLIECLGRDRTRHQVAEVTSLGLVQMTRKRIGTGLLESFSETCPHCKGRGHTVSAEPVEPPADTDDSRRGRGRGGKGRGGSGNGSSSGKGGNGGGKQSDDGQKTRQGPDPAMLAAMARHDKPSDAAADSDAAAESGDDAGADAVQPGFGDVPETDPMTEKGVEPSVEPGTEDATPDEQPAGEAAAAKAPAKRSRSSSSRRTGARKAAAAPEPATVAETEAAPTTAAGAASAEPPVASTTTRTRRTRKAAAPKVADEAPTQADAVAPEVAPHETAATGDDAGAPPAEPAGRDGDPRSDD